MRIQMFLAFICDKTLRAEFFCFYRCNYCSMLDVKVTDQNLYYKFCSRWEIALSAYDFHRMRTQMAWTFICNKSFTSWILLFLSMDYCSMLDVKVTDQNLYYKFCSRWEIALSAYDFHRMRTQMAWTFICNKSFTSWILLFLSM